MIAPESIAEILGLGASVRTVGELELAVSQGLPKRALERLSARDEPAETRKHQPDPGGAQVVENTG